MLKNQRRASVLVFTRRRTLNPKSPKSLNPENSESQSRKPCVYAVFSAISLLMLEDRESSMLSGQTTGSVRNISITSSGHRRPPRGALQFLGRRKKTMGKPENQGKRCRNAGFSRYLWWVFHIYVSLPEGNQSWWCQDLGFLQQIVAALFFCGSLNDGRQLFFLGLPHY